VVHLKEFLQEPHGSTRKEEIIVCVIKNYKKRCVQKPHTRIALQICVKVGEFPTKWSFFGFFGAFWSAVGADWRVGTGKLLAIVAGGDGVVCMGICEGCGIVGRRFISLPIFVSGLSS
jgi:hypothetical protein